MIEEDKPAEDFNEGKPLADDPNTNDGKANAAVEPVEQSATKILPPDGAYPVNQGIKPHARHPGHGNRDQPATVTDKDRAAGQQNPAPPPHSPNRAAHEEGVENLKKASEPGPQDPNAPKPDAAS